MDGYAFAKELEKIAGELYELTAVPRKVVAIAAPMIARIIEEEFDRGVGPQGYAWTPLSRETLTMHGPPPLTDTGAMRGKTRVFADGLLVRGVLYAPMNVHQYGGHPRKRTARSALKPRKRTVRAEIAGRAPSSAGASLPHGSRPKPSGGNFTIPARPVFQVRELPPLWRAAMLAAWDEAVEGSPAYRSAQRFGAADTSERG